MKNKINKLKYRLIGFGIYFIILLLVVNSKLQVLSNDQRFAAIMLFSLIGAGLFFKPSVFKTLFYELKQMGSEMRNDLDEFSENQRRYNTNNYKTHSRKIKEMTGVNQNWDKNKVNNLTGMAPSDLRSDESYKFNKRRRFGQQKNSYSTMKKDADDWAKEKTGMK